LRSSPTPTLFPYTTLFRSADTGLDPPAVDSQGRSQPTGRGGLPLGHGLDRVDTGDLDASDLQCLTLRAFEGQTNRVGGELGELDPATAVEPSFTDGVTTFDDNLDRLHHTVGTREVELQVVDGGRCSQFDVEPGTLLLRVGVPDGLLLAVERAASHGSRVLYSCGGRGHVRERADPVRCVLRLPRVGEHDLTGDRVR